VRARSILAAVTLRQWYVSDIPVGSYQSTRFANLGLVNGPRCQTVTVPPKKRPSWVILYRTKRSSMPFDVRFHLKAI